MARTAIPVTALVPDGGVAMAAAEGATSVDQANGMIVEGTKTEKIVLRVTNTAAAAHGIIIRAADKKPPSWRMSLGDLNVQVAASTGVQWVGPFDSSRFLQSDGSLHVDFEASFAGKIAAVLLP